MTYTNSGFVQPSEKQITYARSLGIQNPQDYSKQALGRLIDEKVGGKPPQQQKALSQAPNQVSGPIAAKHDVVIQRTEKPHSFEFGKAGARHKVYYETVGELISHIQLLMGAGMILDEDVPVGLNENKNQPD